MQPAVAGVDVPASYVGVVAHQLAAGRFDFKRQQAPAAGLDGAGGVEHAPRRWARVVRTPYAFCSGRTYLRIAKALNAPDVREKMIALGAEPVASRPEDFAAYVKAEMPKWARVVKAVGARVD